MCVVSICLLVITVMYHSNMAILTTNLAACVCVCVCARARKILPISALTLLFRLQTSRKFCSHSKIPIRYLWTTFCVPLSFIFYEKQSFTMQIVTLRHTPEQMQCSRADGIVCARTIDASPMNGLEGWAHCGHPSKRDCRQRSGT